MDWEYSPFFSPEEHPRLRFSGLLEAQPSPSSCPERRERRRRAQERLCCAEEDRRDMCSTYATQTEYNTTSNNQDKPWACSAGIRPPDCNAECEEMNEGLVGEDEEEDPSYINTVGLNERLRVTVEITHPALRLPAYLTWTGT